MQEIGDENGKRINYEMEKEKKRKQLEFAKERAEVMGWRKRTRRGGLGFGKKGYTR